MGEKIEMKAGALQELRDHLAGLPASTPDFKPISFTLGFLRRVAGHQCHPPQPLLPDGWRPDREAVARIIDPKGWRQYDAQIECIGRLVSDRQDEQRQEAFFYVHRSLKLADAILAIQPGDSHEQR